MLVNEIRTLFLDYFQKNGHQIVPSAPLIPHNDPTLMFTNAGMVPFKDRFTGKEKSGYSRATSSQKCVRAGGKHNDLDNVGYTARHHTFFEMLGNFSFGDYFKEEAIHHAWQLVTKEIGLDPKKLLVTVYHEDKEAYALWQKIAGLKDDKIIRIATDDNFWAMGDTGPCGPCSEIFFDHGDAIPGGPPGSPDEDGDRFIEIWNLVFMQYNRDVDGTKNPLPKPSIDTGMGLERMAAILQGVHDNYEIDLFKALIANTKELVGGGGEEASYKVIADHLRSMSFLISDGVMPSNEGRGYVLRRIMRRAMRHARSLGAKKPVIYQLVSTLINEMGGAYPELLRAQHLTEEIIKLEEERFGETLDRGLKLLDQEKQQLTDGKLSGEVAFKLYDTYGFPLDLTVDILRNQKIEVDQKGFDACMQEQKQRAKAAWKGSGEAETSTLWYELYEAHGATEFTGYTQEQSSATIMALVKDGALVECAKEGEEVQILLNQTPCYAESGGQEGDHAALRSEAGSVEIQDTKKQLGKLHVHLAKIEQGSIKMGDTVTVTIDNKRRSALRANHSATHLLHAALRNILGDHVTQKGSLVAEGRLRFDISHPKAVSAEELQQIEHSVNQEIQKNHPVDTHLMQQEEALKTGALALFGEKYEDEVRVISIGEPFSVEFCGGTHVRRTGDIGFFKIISETAIAAGVRRIEAITGEAALSYTQEIEATLQDVTSFLKTTKEQVQSRIAELLEERKHLQKQLAESKKASALGGGAADDKIEKIGSISYLAKHVENMPAKELRSLAGELQKQIGEGIVVLTSTSEGKSALIIAISDNISQTISAIDLVQENAELLGARGGGGKPHFAQSGGDDTTKLNEVAERIKERVKNAVNE